MAKKKPTPDDLMLAELRGLRKDLLMFLHLQLRQQQLDVAAIKQFGLFNARPPRGSATADEVTQVLNNIGVPSWPDAIFDLDRAHDGS